MRFLNEISSIRRGESVFAFNFAPPPGGDCNAVRGGTENAFWGCYSSPPPRGVFVPPRVEIPPRARGEVVLHPPSSEHIFTLLPRNRNIEIDSSSLGTYLIRRPDV